MTRAEKRWAVLLLLLPAWGGGTAGAVVINSQAFCSVELAEGGLQQATDANSCELGSSQSPGAGPYARALVDVSAGVGGFGSNFAMFSSTSFSANGAMPPGGFDPSQALKATAEYQATAFAALLTPGPVRQGFLRIEILSSFTSFQAIGGSQFDIAGLTYVDLPDLQPLNVFEDVPITLGDLFEFSVTMSGGGVASLSSGGLIGDSFASVFLTAFELDGTPVLLSEAFAGGPGAGAGDPGSPPTSVPEPASVSLFAAGIGALGLWRRRSARRR